MYDGGGTLGADRPLGPYKNERITGPYAVDPKDPTASARQYDADGIPLTQDAWNMQGSIDHGKQHKVYDDLKQSGKYKGEDSLDQAVINEYLGEARKEGKNAAFMEELMPTQVEGGERRRQDGRGSGRTGKAPAQRRQEHWNDPARQCAGGRVLREGQPWQGHATPAWARYLAKWGTSSVTASARRPAQRGPVPSRSQARRCTPARGW